MLRNVSRCAVALAVSMTLAGSSSARADARTSFLSEQLRKAEDYRVRTQAALALGASSDAAAVKPLCAALSDSNKAVKIAAAAALGKLGKTSAVACLKAAAASESVGAVRAQLAKSLDLLSSPKDGEDPPPPGRDAKVYVAIQVTNKTKRPADDIEKLVRGAMQKKLLSRPGFAVAPRSETPVQGGSVIKSKKMKGYFLLATIEPPLYQGGDLTQVVRVSMWSYPKKVLQGEFAPKFTQEGTAKGDVESETLLLKMCIEDAVETFHKVAASMM